jgi:CubicO group peptidase (beta-lactamase class C family)
MKSQLLFLGSILITCSNMTSTKEDVLKLDNFSIESHENLIKYKKDKKIEGLAFAIFNNKETLYSECVGKSTYGFHINEETQFSIQSISKNITSLAVMIAVQDGLLNLDAPISNYLHSFKVNSCFEDNPEQRITLRMLLSHTAGFTHEAPIGNNYDYRTCSKLEHFNSIMETWLKFPAGKSYSYSNLGFDLAATIIAQTTGLGFNDYLKLKIFAPLGMLSSTTEDQDFITNLNKTEGNIPWIEKKHYSIPLIGSGAVYTNLKDFITYTQLLMNLGQIDNKTLIDRKYLLDMFKINTINYGLGTYVDKKGDILFVNHNGGGYGYSATLLWFPEYNLGSVILCNNSANTFDFCFSRMEDYIRAMKLSKNSLITAEFDTLNSEYFKNKPAKDKPILFSCNCDPSLKTDWNKYVGKYVVVLEGMDLKWYAKAANFFGFGYQKLNIYKEGQLLKFNGSLGEGTLQEFEPGLFFTQDNEAFNLKSEQPTYRNIRIQKRNK